MNTAGKWIGSVTTPSQVRVGYLPQVRPKTSAVKVIEMEDCIQKEIKLDPFRQSKWFIRRRCLSSSP
jgi:hypothetical protein